MALSHGSVSEGRLGPLWFVDSTRGDIVNIDTGHSTAPAKISDLQHDDGRLAVVYCWLYTRGDIHDRCAPDRRCRPFICHY